MRPNRLIVFFVSFGFLFFNKLRLGGAEFKSRCPFMPTMYLVG